MSAARQMCSHPFPTCSPPASHPPATCVVPQRELGLPVSEHIPLLAFIGRLDPQKGADILLEAAKNLLQHNNVQVRNCCLAHTTRRPWVSSPGTGFPVAIEGPPRTLAAQRRACASVCAGRVVHSPARRIPYGRLLQRAFGPQNLVWLRSGNKDLEDVELYQS